MQVHYILALGYGDAFNMRILVVNVWGNNSKQNSDPSMALCTYSIPIMETNDCIYNRQLLLPILDRSKGSKKSKMHIFFN